jgi:hypothetical protein
VVAAVGGSAAGLGGTSGGMVVGGAVWTFAGGVAGVATFAGGIGVVEDGVAGVAGVGPAGPAGPVGTPTFCAGLSGLNAGSELRTVSFRSAYVRRCCLLASNGLSSAVTGLYLNQGVSVGGSSPRDSSHWPRKAQHHLLRGHNE